MLDITRHEGINHSQFPRQRGWRRVYALFFYCLTGLLLASAIARCEIQEGATRIDYYLPLLQGKRVGVVCNQSSKVHQRHLVDTLLNLGVGIEVIFSPEHGFWGKAGAGEKVGHTKVYDSVEVYSLYGKQRKPDARVMRGLDVVLFDLQDVGVRCYTYVSTMQLMMEACLEANPQIPIIVLDRPNPNGHFVAGPTLKEKSNWFVGMHPVPWVHGLTLGEFARMIVGEKWLPTPPERDGWLTVVPCLNYSHDMQYTPPIPPSPNLPTLRSILLYPTLAIFEGANLSVGRGTPWPFEVVGAPFLKKKPFAFTPKAGKELFAGKECHGVDFRKYDVDSLFNNPGIDWNCVAQIIKNAPDESIKPLMDRLLGTEELRKKLLRGASIEKEKREWEVALREYRCYRARYLLYPDSPRETQALAEILKDSIQ